MDLATAAVPVPLLRVMSTPHMIRFACCPSVGFLSKFKAETRFPGCRISAKRNWHRPFVLAAATEDNPALACEANLEQPSIFKTTSSVGSPTEPLTYHEEEKERDNVSSNYDGKMIRVCDKLIDVFMVDKPTPTDWRRLLTFSKEWSNIRPHFFRRCQERADKEENPDMSVKMLRLGRKLKEIDEDVQRHNELFEVLRKAPSEINEVVSRRRKDFTKEFFVHVHTVAESYYDQPADQNEIAKLGNMCLAAVQAYDTATESIEALNAAELKFQDIMKSPSLDAACKKIDNLAAKNELDSALVLMITKAWSAAKESNMMKDEVKDILYHLYVSARGNLQRLMPKEIRILKYLLTLEDPMEQEAALVDAFTPGEELEGTDVDSLYTTPEKLHTWIRTVIDAYNFSREGTLIKEARDLMNPQIIVKLEVLKKVIEGRYM